MTKNHSTLLRKLSGFVLALAMTVIFIGNASGATLAPALTEQIATLADDASVGVVIVSFDSSTGLTDANINLLQSVGVTDAVTFQNLGMVGTVLTVGQVRSLAANPSVKSIWTNDELTYYMNHSRMLTGVDKLRTESAFTVRNGGMPVSGAGDFSVMVIDSGIDATHADLPMGTKVIQNTFRAVGTTTGNTGITVGGVPLNGLTPSLSIENLPNTDNVGHGTHCAGIVGGLGVRSGGLYGGVAPGVKLIGSGGGAVIFVLNALAGWEYALANQYTYNIRVITNSYGPTTPVDYNPNNPFVLASKAAYERNMVVLWAASNDGAEDTINAYSLGPWSISVAAGTKDGMLAGFSSRGVPREQRLSDNKPFNDDEYPTLTAPGSGRAFESGLSRYGFTTGMVATRSSTGLTDVLSATADTTLPVGMLPFYTTKSGTSMATPFVAGVVALMLDVDPTLTPDEVKQILIDTTTRMPGYADHEVGAGYVNAYAAVDKVLNRTKAYTNGQEVSYNAVFTKESLPQQTFNINFDPTVNGPNSANARPFTVDANVSQLKVRATVDVAGRPGATNLVALRLYAPDGTVYSPTFSLTSTSNVREGIVNDPIAGVWYVEARGVRGLSAAPVTSPQQAGVPGPVNGVISQTRNILPTVGDIANSPQRATIETALRRRLVDTQPDGNFYPDALVNREELARSLQNNAMVRQTVGGAPKFGDVSGDLARFAESLTTRGSSLKDYDFAPLGMMSATGTSFNAGGLVNRLDIAVALVKALGRDAEARAKANTTVTVGGQALTDNAQIPASMRGYVQIAIDSGIFEAFPAEIVQIAPGQFQAKPGPRFEPATNVTRGDFAGRLNKYRDLFVIGG